MSQKRIDMSYIKSFKTGSSKAFEDIYLFYRDSVYFFALSIVKHEADAEEVVQDTFMAANAKASTLNKLNSFNSWLFTIAYHNSLSILRKRKKVDYDDVVYDFVADVQDSASDVVDKKEIVDAVAKEIEKMSEKILVVSKLHYLDGLSIKEIALTLDIPEGTVKSRLNRAREVVQPALERSGFTPAKYFVFAFNPVMFQAFKKLVQTHTLSPSASSRIYSKVIENANLIEAGTIGSVGSVSGVSFLTKLLTIASIAGFTAFGVYNATQIEDLEIKQISYYKEPTNSNIEVEVIFHQPVDKSNLLIQFEKKDMKYTVDENRIHFIATKNGSYTIVLNEHKEVVHINNIDRNAPILFGGVVDDSNILQLEIDDDKSGINYQRSFVMQNDKKLRIQRTDIVERLISGEVTIRIYDIAGNYS